MSYLLDTNVIVRLILPHDPLCPVATAAIDELQQRGERLVVAPQNLIELWAVATRPPEINGLGLRPDTVAEALNRIEAMFRVLDDPPGTFRRWRQIVQSHAVKGRQAHDARPVALMVELGIDCVPTFNLDDFRRYHEIRAISPHSLVPLPSEPAKGAE